MRKRIITRVCIALIALLCSVFCIMAFLKPVTVASLMKLDSPKQIAKIELAFCGGDAGERVESYPPFYSQVNERIDITKTELGEEYVKLLFSLPVEELSGENAYPSYFTMGYPEFYALILTIDDPSDTYGAQEYILPVDPLPEFADKPAFMSVRLKLRTAGYEEHIFTLPQHEYFKASFIKDKLI